MAVPDQDGVDVPLSLPRTSGRRVPGVTISKGQQEEGRHGQSDEKVRRHRISLNCVIIANYKVFPELTTTECVTCIYTCTNLT